MPKKNSEDDEIRQIDLGENPSACEFCRQAECICEESDDEEQENPMTTKLYEIYIEPTDDAQGSETIFVRLSEKERGELEDILNGSKDAGIIEHFDLVALEGDLIRSFDDACQELLDLNLTPETQGEEED